MRVNAAKLQTPQLFFSGLELLRSHQVHPVAQVCDLPLSGVNDPLDVVDARAKVGQLALELGFFL